jgi:hypothetical protein
MFKIKNGFEFLFNRIIKTNTKNIPTYTKTSRQKLVEMDEKFIKWIAEVDGDKKCNYQFQARQDVYVFVRIYDNKAVDITGFTQIESADSLVKTVGKEEHEGYHVFHVETAKELKRKNKTIWI